MKVYINDITGPERSTLPIHAAAAKRAELIECFVKRWARPMIACLQLVLEHYKQHTASIQAAHFEKYSALGEKLSSVLEVAISKRLSSAIEKAKDLIKMEMLGLTLNDKDITTQQELMLTKHTNTTCPVPVDSSVLTLIAEIEAYFEVAHKRFVDNICLLVEFDFIRKLQSEIPGVLIDMLNLGATDARDCCSRWLTMDSGVCKQDMVNG